MTSVWTWRQYSVVRALLGSYLVVHFAMLLPWGAELFSSAGMVGDAALSPLIGLFPNILGLFDAPWFVAILLGTGVGAAACLTVGRYDRSAAVWLWFLLACLFGRNPLIANPSLPVVGWLLLFHAFLPRPAEPWAAPADNTAPTVPRNFVTAAWVMLAVAYSFSGWTKFFSPAWVDGETVRFVLENPLARDHLLRQWLLATPEWLLEAVTLGILWLELLFAPLALVHRLRPWIWVGMLMVQLGFLVLLNFADLTFPMLVLHALTFDPAWVRGTANAQGSRVYYDGGCGLCHGWVKFLLAEDRRHVFSFSPLQGETAKQDVPDIASQTDYTSIVVLTPNGERLECFAAVRYSLAAVGGLWRLASIAMAVVPRRIGDAVYRLIARHRLRFYGTRDAMCPLLPQPWPLRFMP